MTTTKRPTTLRAPKTPQAPIPRTIEIVNQELVQKLAQFKAEKDLFQTLVTLAQGRMDYGVIQVVLQRIHDDEMAAREVAAREMRQILAETGN